MSFWSKYHIKYKRIGKLYEIAWQKQTNMASLWILVSFQFLLYCMRCSVKHFKSLQWPHNGRDGVSNYQPHVCFLNRLFRCRSKKTSKPCITGLCAGNSPGTGEFPTQIVSNAEYVSIWWRHHDNGFYSLNYVAITFSSFRCVFITLHVSPGTGECYKIIHFESSFAMAGLWQMACKELSSASANHLDCFLVVISRIQKFEDVHDHYGYQLNSELCFLSFVVIKGYMKGYIQSSAVITRSSWSLFDTQHCTDSSRTQIRLETHLTLMGKLWGVCCEEIREIWLR